MYWWSLCVFPSYLRYRKLSKQITRELFSAKYEKRLQCAKSCCIACSWQMIAYIWRYLQVAVMSKRCNRTTHICASQYLIDSASTGLTRCIHSISVCELIQLNNEGINSLSSWGKTRPALPWIPKELYLAWACVQPRRHQKATSLVFCRWDLLQNCFIINWTGCSTLDCSIKQRSFLLLMESYNSTWSKMLLYTFASIIKLLKDGGDTIKRSRKPFYK